MLWCKSVFAIIAIFVTLSLAWTYHVMIGSRRDNDLANYREDHCQEEQGNGTVHLSMTIMPVKIFVIVFLTVVTVMIKMVPTTMTTKRLWEYIHGNTEGTTTMSLDISRHDSLWYCWCCVGQKRVQEQIGLRWLGLKFTGKMLQWSKYHKRWYDLNWS